MRIKSFLLCVISIFYTQLAFGQIVPQLSYQGMLTDNQGTPVPDATVELTCRLYKVASGGAPIWHETHQVLLSGGVFSTILGSVTPLNLPFDEPYWLGLSINGDSELKPRTQLTASAYSMFAESIADNAVSGKKIRDSAVTGGKIAGGQVVRSINAITDDITLAEGNNIDITKNGNKLTISATGGGGLAEVASNSTLTGRGTAQSPLALANGSVSTVKLQNDAVTGPKIDDGHVVRSINAITDDITLAEGNNINITKNGSRLTIAATSGGLSSVNTNSSLNGAGTNGSPLGVAVPLNLSTSGNYAIRADNSRGHYGEVGERNSGVVGGHQNGNRGFLGSGNAGVRGRNQNGNFGHVGDNHYGVFGQYKSSSILGGLGSSSYGAYGEFGGSNFGGLGHKNYGVWGQHADGHYGGLGGKSLGGVVGGGPTRAGFFQGNVLVTGTLGKGGGSFKIDHPLDPANKYLYHSFVESPDMMNIYNGNIITDQSGYATVELPEYFEALNRDFRYQLTVIGEFAQAIIARKIAGKQFVIRTDKPGVEVSWQVTGIRQDRWANENRIPVEEQKSAIERGFYLHPELFGQPETQGVEWARNPELMRENGVDEGEYGPT